MLNGSKHMSFKFNLALCSILEMSSDHCSEFEERFKIGIRSLRFALIQLRTSRVNLHFL